MLDAKKSGDYIDDEEEKRKIRLEQKKKQTNQNKTQHIVDDKERLEREKDLDPELRKVSNEGRRVGWAYHYRIRRKLDHLKQQQLGIFYCNYYSCFVFFFVIISNRRII